MDHLWAPWRIEYILGDKPSGCIFCQAVAADKSEKNLVLAKSKQALVIMNRYPYNSGHLMVVPNRHAAQFEELTAEEHAELMRLVSKSVKALKEQLQPDGFNIGINFGIGAGAGIREHIHWHVVPRWIEDTNFMPVLGETRVVPEHLKNTYHKLKLYF